MSEINNCYYSEEALSSDAIHLLRLYDAGRVQRFHTTPDYSGAPRQNLADHSWGVAMIVTELCCRLGEEPSSKLLRAALTHDLAEYWTCDLPAHVGWAHPALKETLSHAQTSAEVAHGIWSEHRLTPREKELLRWADGLELYIYATQRARAGVASYRTVGGNIAQYLYHLGAENPTPVTAAGVALLTELRGALS